MTIHSDWARVLHEECPSAFTKTVPRGANPQVGIIDGHLQLMRMHGALRAWDTFVSCLFVKPVERLFEAGCRTVVMCFDCYDSVPAYKSITQGVRASKHEVKVFGANEDLPGAVPMDAMLYLMNRAFKLKVIELVCRRLPAMLALAEGQTLVVDYRRAVAYTPRGGLTPETLPDIAPMGESDVKFCRYVSRYGNALVHAIDGDYLAIALLYYAEHGLREDNKMFIYRHFATLEPAGGGKAPGKGKPEKGKPGKGKARKGPQGGKAKDNKCWVDMQLLFNVVAQAVWHSASAVTPLHPVTAEPFTDGDAVHSATVLMLLAGTDFSRGLPQIGPKRIWEALPDVALTLLHAVRGGSEVDELLLANAVVGRLYHSVYEKHLKGTPWALPSVLRTLAASALADSTKQRLPDVHQVHTTVRNVAWVVRYWCTVNGCVETPLNGENGFTLDEEGQVVFADAAARHLHVA